MALDPELLAMRIRQIQDRLGYDGPMRTERADKQIAKAYLMEGFFMRGGKMYDPNFKHLGLGVYELTAKERQ